MAKCAYCSRHIWFLPKGETCKDCEILNVTNKLWETQKRNEELQNKVNGLLSKLKAAELLSSNHEAQIKQEEEKRLKSESELQLLRGKVLVLHEKIARTQKLYEEEKTSHQNDREALLEQKKMLQLEIEKLNENKGSISCVQMPEKTNSINPWLRNWQQMPEYDEKFDINQIAAGDGYYIDDDGNWVEEGFGYHDD